MFVDLNELAKALDAIAIAGDVLALGGHAEFCWCIEQADDGRWETYWYERGSKNNLACLETESDACFHLLGRLTYSQLLSGTLSVDSGR